MNNTHYNRSRKEIDHRFECGSDKEFRELSRVLWQIYQSAEVAEFSLDVCCYPRFAAFGSWARLRFHAIIDRFEIDRRPIFAIPTIRVNFVILDLPFRQGVPDDPIVLLNAPPRQIAGGSRGEG